MGRMYKLVNSTKYMHNWPHLYYNLKRVSNRFDFDNKRYITSIAMSGIMSIVLLMIICIAYLIYIIIVFIRLRVRSKNEPKDSEPKIVIGTVPTLVVIILVIFVSICVILDIYNLVTIYDRIDTILVLTHQMIDWFNRVRAAIEAVNFVPTFSVKQIVRNLEQQMSTYKAYNWLSSIIPSFTINADKLVDFIDNANDRIFKSNFPTLGLMRLDVDVYPYYIDLYGFLMANLASWIVGFMAAICFLLVVIGIIILCDIFTHHMLAIFTLLSIIGLIVCGMINGLALGGGVFISDFCIDAKDFFNDELQRWCLRRCTGTD